MSSRRHLLLNRPYLGPLHCISGRRNYIQRACWKIVKFWWAANRLPGGTYRPTRRGGHERSLDTALGGFERLDEHCRASPHYITPQKHAHLQHGGGAHTAQCLSPPPLGDVDLAHEGNRQAGICDTPQSLSASLPLWGVPSCLLPFMPQTTRAW